jgi:predicted short-subunit dehydrogenase-like oxidoreductase (DUF2520 family)
LEARHRYRAKRKTVFRAATVFAGSYLITMLDVALQAWCRAGLPEAVAMPIMQS